MKKNKPTTTSRPPTSPNIGTTDIVFSFDLFEAATLAAPEGSAL
jgi:hypothetical protein